MSKQRLMISLSEEAMTFLEAVASKTHLTKSQVIEQFLMKTIIDAIEENKAVKN